MRKYAALFQWVLAGFVYLGLVAGCFIMGIEGLYPPKLNYIEGLVEHRYCSQVKSVIESFLIEGNRTEYYPELSGNCNAYMRLISPGDKVVFHTTEDGHLWSLTLNGEVIYDLESYTDGRRLYAPFSLVLGTVLTGVVPLFVWAHRRDTKRKYVPHRM